MALMSERAFHNGRLDDGHGTGRAHKTVQLRLGRPVKPIIHGVPLQAGPCEPAVFDSVLMQVVSHLRDQR